VPNVAEPKPHVAEQVDFRSVLKDKSPKTETAVASGDGLDKVNDDSSRTESTTFIHSETTRRISSTSSAPPTPSRRLSSKSEV